MEWGRKTAGAVVMFWSKTQNGPDCLDLTPPDQWNNDSILPQLDSPSPHFHKVLRTSENIHLPLNLWGMLRHFPLTNLPMETVWTHLSLCIQIGLNYERKTDCTYLWRLCLCVYLSGRHTPPADLAYFKLHCTAECKSDLSQQNNCRHVRFCYV